MGNEKLISTRFRYISKLFRRKCKGTGKLILFGSDLSKYEICSKSFSKTLYGNKLLVSECIVSVGDDRRFVVRT